MRVCAFSLLKVCLAHDGVCPFVRPSSDSGRNLKSERMSIVRVIVGPRYPTTQQFQIRPLCVSLFSDICGIHKTRPDQTHIHSYSTLYHDMC